MELRGKKIIVGITGSIAAYKSILLVRELVKNGAEVQVILTHAGQEFVTPLTLSVLSERPVLTEFFNPNDGTWNNHVALGLWADLLIVAPATAQTLAKMRNSLCDNLLMAVYLSARCKCVIVPAMDHDMYEHVATQENLEILRKSFKNLLIEPREGLLASGIEGKGRMAEPDEIVHAVKALFAVTYQSLTSKKVLLTAGPTREFLDPVRYLSNPSSGKMGYALANALVNTVCKVYLVSGPVSGIWLDDRVEKFDVVTSDEMFECAQRFFNEIDIAIFCAAVADYKPKHIHAKKIKKESEHYTLELTKNKDIALEFGKTKKNHQISVGFALETDNELEHAKEKLHKKNFDIIVLNSMSDQHTAFEHDTNKITLIDALENIKEYALKDKKSVAEDIVAFLANYLLNKV